MLRPYFAGFESVQWVNGQFTVRLHLDRFTAEHAEFSRYDLVCFGEQSALASFAEDLLELVTVRESK